MSKKNFGASLRKTTTDQEKVIEGRFAAADSTLLSGKPAGPATSSAPTPVAKATKPVAPAETANGALVTRDTFSMPGGDYGLIEQLRIRAAKEGRNTNKSEVVRAGLQSLMALEPAKLLALLDGLERVKPGRK